MCHCFMYHQKEKETCCLLIYGLWLTVRNILIVEMLKQKVGIRKTFTCETHFSEQHEPACCPSPKLWYWHLLLPSLTCASSTVKSSQLPFQLVFSPTCLCSLLCVLPISFSYYHLILFLIYISSNMQKNAKQKGYVYKISFYNGHPLVFLITGQVYNSHKMTM